VLEKQNMSDVSLRSSEEFARSYLTRVTALLENLDTQAIAQVIEVFLDARKRDAHIFFLGNGGSAATALHFANDLGVCASPEGRRPFRAVSLTANTSLITCLANDIGYENVFRWQLRNLMRLGDVVVGISASGNSPNVVRGLEYAAENGGIPVAIVGFDGGAMKKMTKYVIHVATDHGEYGPSEDVHMTLDHLMSTYLALIPE
jgi:D-sedoheptulose 7-phosphate isomerase